jgi:hypothetical protein
MDGHDVLAERILGLREVIEGQGHLLSAMSNKLNAMDMDLRQNFVPRMEYYKGMETKVSLDRYVWVERIVIGLVGIILAGVVGAIVSSVLSVTK